MTPHFAQVFEALSPKAKDGGKTEGKWEVSTGEGGKVRLGTANVGEDLNGNPWASVTLTNLCGVEPAPKKLISFKENHTMFKFQ